MARLTTTLPYALFTVLILLFLSSLASAKTNGTIINNGTYITPTHKPTAHSTVVPTTTLAPKTTATETASSTGSQPTETVVTAGVPLTYSGTGTSLVGALAVGVLVGLGLELGL